MKRYLPLLFGVLLLFLPVLRAVMQDNPVRLEVTGINTSDMPTVTITTSVVDSSGQSIPGLGIQSFTLSGPLTERAHIVSVQNITENNLEFAAVLVIDTSSSVAGEPFHQIQEAARLFVNSVGDNDPIAIVTFNTDVQLVQDYTTDKSVLLSAIDNLSFGGKTALYDAAVFGADVAARAPFPRRAVILLSDGAEFGGVSDSPRDAGLKSALAQSVPFYTIGLGYGTDRTYLSELARNTSARFNEAPTAEELSGIYQTLAQLFRSQYVITLGFDNFDPLQDGGHTYDLTLQASAPQGNSNDATATLRVPVPQPIVSLPDGTFTTPISEPVTVTPTILADDDITSIQYTIGATTTTGESLVIDPTRYQPGTYPLTIRVTDSTGDVTSIDTQFEIAALPSDVVLNWTPGDAPITTGQSMSVTVTGQTEADTVTYSITTPAGESALTTDDDNTNLNFEFDPFNLPVGDYVLHVDVVNKAGVTTSVEQPFSVGAIAPRNLVVSGITEGQTIDAPVTVSVNADTQSGSNALSPVIKANDTELSGMEIDPMQLQPGNTPVTVTIATDSGVEASQTVNVTIAALPATVEITAPESPVTAPVDIPVDVKSQTLIIGATYTIDGGNAVNMKPDGNGGVLPISLDPATTGNGEHTLAVRIVNAGQQVTTAEAKFTVLLPSPTPTATFTPTVDVTGTAAADAAVVEATSNAVSTTSAESTSIAASTQGAVATTTAIVVSTASAQETSVAQETAAVKATESAQLTATADQVRANAAGTVTAIASATQASISATQNAVATANAQLTQSAMSTQNAAATAEQQSQNELATATLQALATLDVQATARAQRTVDAQDTAIARVNASAFATATAMIQSTLDAQATQDAFARQQVFGTLTAAAVDTQTALNAVTATQNAALTQTALAMTQVSQQTATADAASNETNARATQDAESTKNAGATGTASANASATNQAESTSVANAATSDASDSTATAAAEGTVNAAATQTAQPTITPSPAPQVATLTPVDSTATPVPGGDAQSAPGGINASSLLPICVAGLIILLLVIIVLFLRGRRDAGLIR